MRGIRFLSAVSAVSVALLAGCASHEEYVFKDAFPYQNVCIVDNKTVPASFFLYLRKAVEDKGLTTKTVSDIDFDNEEGFCQAYILYEAQYKRKAAQNYLDYAEIYLLRKNHPGYSVEMKQNRDAPDSLLDQMTDPEPAVRYLVNRLLPRETPW